MNIDSLMLLNETVVDRLLDVFGDDFRIDNKYANSVEFEKHMQILLRKYNIKITFDKTMRPKGVSGEYRSWSQEIIISIPRVGFNFSEVIPVIFHEFAHHIKEIHVPGYYNPTQFSDGTYIRSLDPKDHRITNPYGLYGLFLEKDSEELMNRMITYWTQQHERSGIAFMIAYDLYQDMKFSLNSFDELVNEVLVEWKKYHEKGEHGIINEYMNHFKFHDGMMILVAIIFYRQELISRQLLTHKLNFDISRLLELTKKYYRRVGGILNKYKK